MQASWGDQQGLLDSPKNVAREAVAGDDGMPICPLVNLDMKGGALHIMLQQFMRAVGVVIVQGNAKHKLGHLHYI